MDLGGVSAVMWNHFAVGIRADVKVSPFKANRRTTKPPRGTCRFVAERHRERPKQFSQEASRVSSEMMGPARSCSARIQCGLLVAWRARDR